MQLNVIERTASYFSHENKHSIICKEFVLTLLATYIYITYICLFKFQFEMKRTARKLCVYAVKRFCWNVGASKRYDMELTSNSDAKCLRHTQ